MKTNILNFTLKSYSLFVLLLVIYVLFDPRLFFIYLTGDRFVGQLIFGFTYILIVAAATLNLSKYPRQLWGIVVFFGYTILISFYRGVIPPVIILMPKSLFVPLLFFKYYIRGIITISSITSTFIIVALSHLIFSIYSLRYPDLVSTFTSYGILNNLDLRAVGIFVAPGVLSFFSVLFFCFGYSMYKEKQNISYIILVLLSIFTGVLSGNRSFLIGIVAVVIINIFQNHSLLKILKQLIPHMVVLVVFLILVYIIPNDILSRGESLANRYEIDEIDSALNERIEGDAGIKPGIYSLAENPIFGNVVWDKKLMVKSNNITSTVNNGFISIFAYYGIPAGLFFFYIYFGAFFRYKKLIKFSLSLEDKRFYRVMYNMLISGSIVCMTDSFLFAPIMLIIIVLPYFHEIGLPRTLSKTRLIPN
jgi:hypothetical protein